jgi:hypothetical protein
MTKTMEANGGPGRFHPAHLSPKLSIGLCNFQVGILIVWNNG